MDSEERALLERIRGLLQADGYQHPAEAFFLTPLKDEDGYLLIARH